MQNSSWSVEHKKQQKQKLKAENIVSVKSAVWIFFFFKGGEKTEAKEIVSDNMSFWSYGPNLVQKKEVKRVQNGEIEKGGVGYAGKGRDCLDKPSKWCVKRA